jgi:ribose transport system substrate-binding protein
MLKRSRRGFAVFLILSGLAAVLLAACGGSDDSGGAAEESGGESTNAAKEAAARTAAATEIPEFVGPDTPFDIGELRGKKILVLNGNSVNPFNTSTMKGAAEAARVAGLEVREVDGGGQPSNWDKAIRQAVAIKDAGIIMMGVPPDVVKGALRAAQKADIPVVNCYDVSLSTPKPPGLVGVCAVDPKKNGAVIADYIASEQNGEPTHVLAFTDDSFPSVKDVVDGFIDQMKKVSPDTVVNRRNILAGKIATDLGLETQTELRSDPEIEWIVAAYDSEALYIVPAVKQANMDDKVRVVGHDAALASLEYIQAGNVQSFTIGAPSTWGGWAGIDALSRAMLGMPQEDEKLPSVAFTQESLEGKDIEDQVDLFGGDFRASYRELWGLTE